ncbi:cobalt-precorrin-7 (C(5))-methyltransferase [Halalkalirubrum salinum]|uniref:cobalt-precorrin-7 (C(5))-methyltransferase n=1 Tax=Halalkalirubrum salinum TaxID=2563889 RepID=UPI0010FB963D|nr:cobalt-precorrin-7 (C(5))-methyltransferase [Halalkalirubrum salinum]
MSKNDPYNLDSGPDPATYAAAEPESTTDADRSVAAVGIGPGNLEYLTPRGRRAVQEADVIVGFQTVVDYIADETDADLLTCGYADEADALGEFATRVHDSAIGTAVLMGDPNYSGYQFLGKVQRVVDTPVTVIPGISALQIAASRARTPMEDTQFVTLHKSGSIEADLDRLAEAVGERHLLVLPRPFDWMPGDIAAFLLDAGADESLDALVLERLTHDDEQITQTTLGELSVSAGGSGSESTPYSDLSVLAVRAPIEAEADR